MQIRLRTLDGAVRIVEHPARIPVPEFFDMPMNQGVARAATHDEVTAPIPMRRYVRAGVNCGIIEFLEQGGV